MKWPTKPLGELFDIQLGKMLDADGNKGDPYPYLANRNVQWDECEVTNLSTMRFTAEDQSRFSLVPGDLLVCEGGEVGRTAVWRGEVTPCYFQKAVHRLRARRPAEPRFALHYMRWATDNGVFRHLTTSTSIAHLTKEKLSTAPFPVVPLPEQQRIAKILDAADALRARRRAALGQLDTLTQSIFLDMFGDPKTISGNVRFGRLSEFCTRITDGTHQPPTWSEAGHPFLFVSNITSGEITFDTAKFISDETYAELTRRCPIELGDVLYSTVGSYGVPAVVRTDRKFAFQRHIAHIKPNRSFLSADFLAALLASPNVQRQADIAARGMAQKTVNLADIKKFEVFCPPLALQQLFARRVAAVDKLKTAHRASLAELDALFASLQHRAFRGEL